WLPIGILILCFHLVLSAQVPDFHFEDPGIGWHLKSGELMLEQGGLLEHDPFAWTLEPTERIQYEWLSDVVFASLHQIGSLPLFSACMALLYGILFYLISWRLIQSGIHPLINILTVGMAYLILGWHALARPHLFTYLFLLVTLWLLDRYYHKGRGLKSLWPLIPIVALWCNMHGGFVIGLLVIFLTFVGYLIEALLNRESEVRSKIPPLMVTGIFCGLATLLNPYGWHLHLHILSYLNLECLQLWNEFQPPVLNDANIHLFLFKVLLISMLVLGLGGAGKTRWDERVLLAFLLFYAFQSVRHVNLFVLMATPVLAGMLQHSMTQSLPEMARRGREMASLQAEGWLAGKLTLLLIGMLWLGSVWAQPSWHAQRVSSHYLSPGAIDFITTHQREIRRPFNHNNLGGSLIYDFYPNLQIFMDDRADLFQDDFVFNTYLPISKAEPGWSERLLNMDTDALILNSDSPLARAATKEENSWKLGYQDSQNTIFLRRSR
ncbi:MAG: hypothetical protein AAF571_05800, partial [Verrucomicrobiota bacterium]